MLDQVRIAIELDHEREDASRRLGNLEFYAGGEVRGNIMVEVRRPVERPRLLLNVLGQEQTSVPISTSRINRDVKIFFREETTLHQSRSTPMEEGLHIFPFTILLPETLPSSVGAGKVYNGCLVQYLIFATMKNEMRFRYFRIRAAAPLSVPEHSLTVVPSTLVPRTETVRSMGVKRVGSISYGVRCLNTHVSRGDMVEVALACQNNSAVGIDHVDLKLIEMYTWCAHREKAQEKRTLATVRDLDLAGLVRGKRSVTEVRDNQRNRVDMHSVSREEIEAALERPENKLSIEMPLAAMETYDGINVNVSHYLKIYFRTETFVTNVTAKIPLQVNAVAHAEEESHSRTSANYPVTQLVCESDDAPIPFADAVLIESGGDDDDSDALNHHIGAEYADADAMVLVETAEDIEGNVTVFREAFPATIETRS